MSVEDLDVYNKINEMVLSVYKITKHFPKEELYGIVSQMRRAVISIGSNLLEGNYRESTKDFVRFISISKSSAAELKYQLFVSKELKYIKDECYEELNKNLTEIIKMLSGLRNSLKNKKNNRS
jgi:four helix bundle protein